MLEVLENFLFGCLHRQTSFPITPRPRPGRGTRKASVPFPTYVVCLDCGKEFPYSWEEMRILRPEEVQATVGEPVRSLQATD